MTQNNPQVPWTDEQWNRVTQVIQEEACRARVAATFLPLYGPLPPDTDFVRNEGIQYPRYPDGAPPPTQRMAIDDTITIQLATLQVKVIVRGAQLADPEMTSVLALFRRAANVLARLEDVVVFRGLKGPAGSLTPIGGADPLPAIWEITAGDPTRGLWERPPEVPTTRMPEQWIRVGVGGEPLVNAVSDAIGRLEDRGHFGPFAVVFGQQLFLLAQTPEPASLVLPQDRIIPFLGGGPLLRSSALTDYLVSAAGAVDAAKPSNYAPLPASRPALCERRKRIRAHGIQSLGEDLDHRLRVGGGTVLAGAGKRDRR